MLTSQLQEGSGQTHLPMIADTRKVTPFGSWHSSGLRAFVLLPLARFRRIIPLSRPAR